MDQQKENLWSLQLLRAIAAISVVIWHGQIEVEQMVPTFTKSAQALKMGVDIFFVISGFIMVYTSRASFGGEGASGRFLMRRAARVIPLYWFFTLAMIAAVLVLPTQLASAKLEWGNVLGSFLFFPVPAPDGQLHPILELGWTLNYEMFFYLVFALTMLLPYRAGVMACTLIMVGLVAMGLLFRPTAPALIFWTDPIILEFVSGCLLAVAFLHFGTRPSGIQFLVAAGAAILLLWALVGAAPFLRPVTYGLPSLVLVAGAVFFLPRPKASHVAYWGKLLGDASYSIYLSHPFTLAICALLARRLSVALDPLTFVASATIASIVAGVLAHWLLERPMAIGIAAMTDPRPRRV